MKGNNTLTIIKPNAVENDIVGPILCMINDAGFYLAAIKTLKLTFDQAEAFYAVHKGKPFYEGLIKFMTSGPVVVAILEKENAVEAYRELMGPTDPSEAKEGTIRHRFGESIQKNAVHGSDSDENAMLEIGFFFSKHERFSKYHPITLE